MDLGGEQVVLRPSLCPHHALIYRSRSHSYRELPLRMAELGGMFREERSGVLGGLSRVRAIQLNDAHIFCTLDQAADEARAALELIRQAYAALGIRAVRHRLSLPGPGGKYVADPAMWERASALLAEVLESAGIAYEAVEGEAAFYGPKIDVQIADGAGREATLSTVQIDFHQPEQFDLHYIGPDGGRHRPVMVHRSIIGSVERAVAHLIELYGGAFPAWLAPTQVAVLPVSDAELPQAERLVRHCLDLGLRAELAGPERGTLGARVRGARLVPYQAVIGPKEAVDGHVALRLRDGRRPDPMPAAEALTRIGALVDARGTDLWEAAEGLTDRTPPGPRIGMLSAAPVRCESWSAPKTPTPLAARRSGGRPRPVRSSTSDSRGQQAARPPRRAGHRRAARRIDRCPHPGRRGPPGGRGPDRRGRRAGEPRHRAAGRGTVRRGDRAPHPGGRAVPRARRGHRRGRRAGDPRLRPAGRRPARRRDRGPHPGGRALPRVRRRPRRGRRTGVLSSALRELGLLDEAVAHDTRAAALYRETRDDAAEADAPNRTRLARQEQARAATDPSPTAARRHHETATEAEPPAAPAPAPAPARTGWPSRLARRLRGARGQV